MAKPKQTGKHKFSASVTNITYESSPHPTNGDERFDPNLPTTVFRTKFTCMKCRAEVEVIRNTVKSQFNKVLAGDLSHVAPPKRNELSKLGIPRCSRWKAIQQVMES